MSEPSTVRVTATFSVSIDVQVDAESDDLIRAAGQEAHRELRRILGASTVRSAIGAGCSLLEVAGVQVDGALVSLEPPEWAWFKANGHEWATDGRAIYTKDGPRPRAPLQWLRGDSSQARDALMLVLCMVHRYVTSWELNIHAYREGVFTLRRRAVGLPELNVRQELLPDMQGLIGCDDYVLRTREPQDLLEVWRGRPIQGESPRLVAVIETTARGLLGGPIEGDEAACA